MKNWEVKTLGDIGKVSMCKRVFKEDTLPTGDIPFYKIGTFGKEPNAYITKERYDEFRRKFSFPKKGDILISASGTIGRCVRYDGEPAYFQDSNIVWIDNDEKNVLNSFLYRFYEVCNWGSTKGATIARLYNSNLKQIEIAYPKSLHEQQRIVAILDEVFEAIAKAKANTEQNLKNAKELFDVYLHKFYTSKEEGWEEKKLKEVAEYFNGLTYSPKNVSNEGIIVLRSSNVQNDVLDFKDIVRVNLNVKEKIIVKELSLKLVNNSALASKSGKGSQHITYRVGASDFDEEKELFSTGFICEINPTEEEALAEGFNLKIDIIGVFSVDTDNFKVTSVEHFALHNAPVILLPYVREHVFTLTSRAGIDCLLPLVEVPVFGKI